MNKTTKFLSNLVLTLDSVDTDIIKSKIGDSVDNNRTVSVNQTIRFLTSSRNVNLRNLGRQLRAIYSSNKFKSLLRANRARTYRTDAVDINEFIATLESAVRVPAFNRSVARTL